jgi:hypothetical protein
MLFGFHVCREKFILVCIGAFLPSCFQILNYQIKMNFQKMPARFTKSKLFLNKNGWINFYLEN